MQKIYANNSYLEKYELKAFKLDLISQREIYCALKRLNEQNGRTVVEMKLYTAEA